MRSCRDEGDTRYHQCDEIKHEMTEECGAYAGECNEYSVLMRNSEGKRLHRRHSRRWKDNTEKDFQEIRRESVGRINVDRDTGKWLAVMNKAMQFRISQNLEYFLPYILESNLHPYYSFRGLKNQMLIRIACGLDSRSRAGFWKNDRAVVHA